MAKPPRRTGGGTSILAHGENMVWIMGGALALCAVMVAGLLALVLWQGSTTFWPRPVEAIRLTNGTVFMGEVTRHDTLKDGDVHRRLVRTGNFERTGTHFEWITDGDIANESRPTGAVVLERRAWGRFYGIPTEFRVDGKTVATGPEAAWNEFEKIHGGVLDRFNRRYHLQRDDYGALKQRLTDRLRESREPSAPEDARDALVTKRQPP
jgi:phosphate transport system permease protein